MTEPPKGYQLTKDDVRLFLRSKEFKQLADSGFAQWGSKRVWAEALKDPGSAAKQQVVDFTKANAQKAASPVKKLGLSPNQPDPNTASKQLPNVFARAKDLQQAEAYTAELKAQLAEAEKQKKLLEDLKKAHEASSQIAGNPQKKSPVVVKTSPLKQNKQAKTSPLKTSPLKQNSQTGTSAGNISISDVDKDAEIRWVENRGLLDAKGNNISFGGGSKLDTSKTESWFKLLNKHTGTPKAKPLSKSEIQEKRFHGLTQHELDHNKKFRRTSQESTDNTAPAPSKQPFWETKPANYKQNIDYRFDLARLWEEVDIDFSKIPNPPSTAREKAFRRLKRYNTMSPENTPVAEIILLRHQVSRLSLAVSCLNKLMQQITVQARNKEVLQTVAIARRIFADTMHPHYVQLAELDELFVKTKINSPKFVKKQKILISKLIKEMYTFPTFESVHTDTSLDEDPKHYTLGKPLGVDTFEKKCLELCKKKQAKKPQGKPEGKKQSGVKRKTGNPAPKAPKSKKQKTNKKKAWECKVCNKWHGYKDNYKCPNS